MTTRANGPGAGWSWLMQGINTGRHNPKAIFGATAILMVFALLPSVVQMALNASGKLDLTGMIWVIGLGMLLGVVLYPLLLGGLLRIIDAGEHGQPARAMTLFEPFRAGQGGARLIAFSVILMLVYLAVLAVLLLTIGRGTLDWYLQLVSLGIQGSAAKTMPTLPDGFGPTFGLLMLFGVFYTGVYSIGLGQVALRNRGPLQALREGVAGTLKNVLPLLVLAVSLMLALLVFCIAFGLVVGLVMVLASLVSPTLALVLLVPVYLAMMLVLYVVMVGLMYAVWQGACTDGKASGGTNDGTYGNQDAAPAGLEA